MHYYHENQAKPSTIDENLAEFWSFQVFNFLFKLFLRTILMFLKKKKKIIFFLGNNNKGENK